MFIGWDITGMIECQEAIKEHESVWIAVRGLNALYEGRNYDSFGCLFGWQNYAHFRPIAEGCGLPPDVSSEVKEDCERYDGEEAGTTWISWAEIFASLNYPLSISLFLIPKQVQIMKSQVA